MNAREIYKNIFLAFYRNLFWRDYVAIIGSNSYRRVYLFCVLYDEGKVASSV